MTAIVSIATLTTSGPVMWIAWAAVLVLLARSVISDT